jgi:hypothetical protein
LSRSRHLFAFKEAGELKAVFMINIADIGLNMSDLTNCVKVIILKSDGLSYPVVQAALSALFDKLRLDEMPVLAYPAQSATALAIPTEKTYHLWIYDLNYTDDYFSYLKRLLKFVKH